MKKVNKTSEGFLALFAVDISNIETLMPLITRLKENKMPPVEVVTPVKMRYIC